MQRSVPSASAGFSRLAVSIAPPEPPVPMVVWISSMNRTAPGGIADLGDHSLQPLFEIPGVAGPRHQCSQVEREDASALQGLRRLALDDAQRQPLGDGGLAD